MCGLVFRVILWGSLGLVPADVVASLLGASPTLLFVISALALVPLAWVIGEATDCAGVYTGPILGGLLNASFGNAPELIFSMFAVNQGLFTVVRGSLTGSVIGNLLLVLGFSLAVGGDAKLDRRSVFHSIYLVALAAALFVLPSVWHWLHPKDHGPVAVIAIPVSTALLAIYLVSTAMSLKREKRIQGERNVAIEQPRWSLKTSVIILAVATVATAVVTEVLTQTIEDFAARIGVGDFFVAAVIIAIVGNAAEHGGAVVIARNGNVDLASEIALRSSAQVALFVIPFVVLISYALTPLPMDFRGIELGGLAAAIVLPALLLADGRSSRLKGIVLVAAYTVVAIAFLLAS